jgi:hypothetical protein
MEDLTLGVLDTQIQKELTDRRARPPATWQYRTLQFQESAIATTFVFGIVLFELIFVGNLRDKEDLTRDKDPNAKYDDEPSFYWGLIVSVFFVIDILLRYYTWSHTVAQIEEQKASARSQDDSSSPAAAAAKVGGFFSNKFRLLDSLLVVLDLFMFTLELILINSNVDAKATTKLARIVRLARSAKWLGRLKILRSLRFFHRFGLLLRKFGQPSRRNVVSSLQLALQAVDEAADGWAGPMADIGERIKADLSRSTSKVLAAIKKRDGQGNDNASNTSTSSRNIEMAARLGAFEATLVTILEQMKNLQAIVGTLVRNGCEPVPPVNSSPDVPRSESIYGARNVGWTAARAAILPDRRGSAEDIDVGGLGDYVRAEERARVGSLAIENPLLAATNPMTAGFSISPASDAPASERAVAIGVAEEKEKVATAVKT